MLRHADCLCVIDGRSIGLESMAEFLPEVKLVESLDNSGYRVVRASRNPVELVALGQTEKRSLDSLRGRRVGLLTGVARPESVRRTVEALGACVVAERRFRDHHTYTAKDCHGLDHSSLMWMTTEKDALKILPEWLGDDTLWVLRIEIEIDEEEAVLDCLEARLHASGRLPPRPVERVDQRQLDLDLSAQGVR
jgi:tetraacyldisaccharide-1-P 4'-kinase